MLQRLSSALKASTVLGEHAPWCACPAAALQIARGLKVTTGIVGLEVDPHARESVQTKAEAVLDAVKVIDANVQYRKNVEATFGFWLKQVQSPATDDEIEDTLNFQLEELSKMADDELSLIPQMAEWQPWDVPEGYTIPQISTQEVGEKLDAAK